MANTTENSIENINGTTTTVIPISSTSLPTTSTILSVTTTALFPTTTTTTITTTQQIITDAVGLSPEILAIPTFSRYEVYIAVCSVCAVIILVSAFIILLKLFFFPDRFILKNPPQSSSANSTDELPPAPNPVQYHVKEYTSYQDSVTKRGTSEKRRSSIYAKPEIYSTYINPTFYEDAYERWRRQEAENIYTSDPIYVSPRQVRPVVFNNGIYATYSPQPTLALHDVVDGVVIDYEDEDGIEMNQDEEDYEETAVEESWDDESFSERPTDDDEANCPVSDPRISRISLLTHDNRRFSRSWHEDSDDEVEENPEAYTF